MSSNNYVFMAIVAHYITTAGVLGKSQCAWILILVTNWHCSLEELLIDFRELEGEHSGMNLAGALWETLTMFGIENWVCHLIFYMRVYLTVVLQIMAIMMDNASNNNTLIQGIVGLEEQKGISLNAQWICLRCMLHTVHLAVLKVSNLMFLSFAYNTELLCTYYIAP